MDPPNHQDSNPYHYPEDMPEDEPEDKPEHEPEEDESEDELSTRNRERPQPLAKGPFSKPSGYLPPDYYHRQQEFLTAEENTEPEIQGRDEDAEPETAGQRSEDESEEEVEDICQKGEDDSRVAEKELEEETSDETTFDQLPTDPDVNTQAKPGQDDVPVEETSEAASAQETK